ncbi:MAG: NADPH-dependent oxidoreductase [Anaerolineae bacterium]|jgi:FMN reductase (NADPH)|nr:NADPH-dependent oxidoreductase [Anaerolineae bacterium]MBT7071799.1 NADPH-dependent oxidoreductase [Anaerolineae bacterium]MBT7324046.1 NADPH-dependent oxidoreductase [Anaerolineae bacterium]
MDNSTLNLIHAHGSVRRYKPDPVPASLIERIVAAGQRASTSSNMQTFSVVAVTDAENRAALAELCGGQKHIIQAPVFLTWCADRYRLERVCQMRGYAHNAETVENFLVAAVDAAIAAQNAALAAESLGLGICYIGSIRNNSARVIELLNLPEHVFPVSGMTIGYPEQPPRIRPRLSQEAILHWEEYEQDQDAALYAYDKAMIETGIYNGRQVDVPGKEGEMEEYGWLEHTARRTSGLVRAEMLSVIKKQGFGMK